MFSVVIATGIYEVRVRSLCAPPQHPTVLLQNFKEREYLLLAVFMAAPSVLYPLFFPGKVDQGTPILERYW